MRAVLWCCWLGITAADVALFTDVDEYTALVNSSNGIPSQTFRSSDIVAPVFLVNSWDKAHVDNSSHIFLGAKYGPMKAGPMIFDSRDLSLVYADQQYPKSYSSNVHEINGARYLTSWVAASHQIYNNGYCLVFDDNYNLKYNVTAQGLEYALADMHEMIFTPDGNIVFSTYFNISFDLSSVGGPENGSLLDNGFQEVDPETNEVIFQWAASDHFAVNDTYAEFGKSNSRIPHSGFDFFHINSIEKTPEGNYLISSRHFSLIALIDGTSGHPIWFLGGRYNQFTDLSNGLATNFDRQHHARFHRNQSHLTIFDNHGGDTGYCEDKCNTRGLHLEINTDEMTVRVVHEYFHPERIDSGAMGGLQILDSGNAIIGWGYNPTFVEYHSDGTPVLDVQRGNIGVGRVEDMFVYRVNKCQWEGKPTWPPSIAIDAPNSTAPNAMIYVSWNGATEVASWIVYSSNDATTINRPGNLVAKSDRTGFETTMSVYQDKVCRFVRAIALSASGKALGSTCIVDMESNQSCIGDNDIVNTGLSPFALSATFNIKGGGTFIPALVLCIIYCVWRIRVNAVTEDEGFSDEKFRIES